MFWVFVVRMLHHQPMMHAVVRGHHVSRPIHLSLVQRMCRMGP